MALGRPFRIAIVPGVNPGKWTRLWALRRPGSPLEVLPVVEAQQQAVLDTAQVDMVFARLPIESESLHVIRLYEETAVVVAERDHPISLVDSVTTAELAGETVLPQPLSETVDLVVAGAGIALVPQSVARQLSRSDLVVRPVTDAPPTTIALVWPRAVESADIDEFIGIVRGRTTNSSRGS